MNPDLKDTNPLAISWHDTTRIPSLNPSNILDYFCDRCNPFYQKTCNNEILRMQNRDMDQLSNMVGAEYIVLHVQEPILYVIRKQHRLSPAQVTPLADYYILAGTVYQAPDLQSVVNSRLTTCMHHLMSAFDETVSFMKYHPTKGYSWQFTKDSSPTSSTKSKDKDKAKDGMRVDAVSVYQRRRVDALIHDLVKKFPAPNPRIPAPVASAPDPKSDAAPECSKTDAGPAAVVSRAVDKQMDGSGTKRVANEPLGPPQKMLRQN